MARLFFDPEPLAEWMRLEADERSYGRLLDRVDLRLGWLEEDPGHRRCRGVRFQGGLWYLRVPVDEGDWAILWEEHPTEPDAVAIRYIGPDFK